MFLYIKEARIRAYLVHLKIGNSKGYLIWLGIIVSEISFILRLADVFLYESEASATRF